MHGRFAWYDLMTPDIAAAKKFYPTVTGWSTEEWDKGPYSMWKAGDESFAGMNPITPEQRAQGVPAHWLAYVNVDNVESAANKVRSLGGKVLHGPEDIPEVGRFAIIQDPQGATLAIFKGSGPWPGWDGTPSVGKFSWHELMTTDYRGAFEFYRQLFGWDKQSEMESPDGPYLMYGKEGKMYGGIYNRPARVGNVPPNWMFYVNVKDVNRAVDSAKRGGGTLAMGPMEVPGGDRVAMMKDPQGAMFAVHQSIGKQATAPKAKSRGGAKAAKSGKSAKRKAAKSSRKTARKSVTKRASKRAARRSRKSARTARRAPARRARRATARSKKRGRR
jgi:hypothetical protein